MKTWPTMSAGIFLKGKCKYGEKCFKEHPDRGTSKNNAKDSQNKEEAKDKKAADKSKTDGDGLTCFRCNQKGHIAKNCRVKIKGVAAPVIGEDGESHESSESESEKDDVNFAAPVIRSSILSTNRVNEVIGDTIFGLDTCASSHITNNYDDFIPGTVKRVRKSLTVGNSGSLDATAVGRVKLSQGHGTSITISMLYAPDSPIKLISMGQLVKKGFKLEHEGSEGTISKNGLIILKAIFSKNIMIVKDVKVVRETSKDNVMMTTDMIERAPEKDQDEGSIGQRVGARKRSKITNDTKVVDESLTKNIPPKNAVQMESLKTDNKNFPRDKNKDEMVEKVEVASEAWDNNVSKMVNKAGGYRVSVKAQDHKLKPPTILSTKSVLSQSQRQATDNKIIESAPEADSQGQSSKGKRKKKERERRRRQPR